LRPYLEKIHHKKELVEWLKVQALSSSPSTTKNKEINKKLHSKSIPSDPNICLSLISPEAPELLFFCPSPLLWGQCSPVHVSQNNQMCYFEIRNLREVSLAKIKEFASSGDSKGESSLPLMAFTASGSHLCS
jgi:hypothetical protein